MVKLNQVYGLESPVQNTYPLPIIANRVPDSDDKNFIRGQIWIFKPIGRIYILSDVANSQANWTQIGAGTGDVEQNNLTNGQTTIVNPAITDADLVFVSRVSNGDSTALGELEASPLNGSIVFNSRQAGDPVNTEAGDQSIFNYFVIGQ